MQTDLYRHFDKNGRLLYVGISNCALSRAEQHQSSAPWFHDATRMTVEQFDSRAKASAAEADAVVSEKPIWNDKLKAGFKAKKKYPTITFRPSAMALELIAEAIKAGKSQSKTINEAIVQSLAGKRELTA